MGKILTDNVASGEKGLAVRAASDQLSAAPGAGAHDYHTAAVSGKAGRIVYEADLAGEIEQPEGCLFRLLGQSLLLFGRLDQAVDALADAPVQGFLPPADAQ